MKRSEFYFVYLLFIAFVIALSFPPIIANPYEDCEVYGNCAPQVVIQGGGGGTVNITTENKQTICFGSGTGSAGRFLSFNGVAMIQDSGFSPPKNGSVISASINARTGLLAAGQEPNITINLTIDRTTAYSNYIIMTSNKIYNRYNYSDEGTYTFTRYSNITGFASTNNIGAFIIQSYCFEVQYDY